MKTFELITPEKTVVFNFPTSLNEITQDYLLSVTENVNVANDYSLVAIVYHESLGSIILARKQSKKSMSAGVIPVFVKSGITDNSFIKSANCKDKLIISTSQLSLGHHVAAPSNTLSLDYFINILDKDFEVAKRNNNNYGKEHCFFIEFKIVPNCDIIGFYKDDKINFDNPYIIIAPNADGAA